MFNWQAKSGPNALNSGSQCVIEQVVRAAGVGLSQETSAVIRKREPFGFGDVSDDKTKPLHVNVWPEVRLCRRGREWRSVARRAS
jgi:hypothetical protein